MQGNGVIEIALKEVNALAEARARAFLCPDCRDQRCKAGRDCKAFTRQTEAEAWQIKAERAERN